MLEPQNKLNVEFQPSKKMKKRRELDALVCNGKVRRKTKTGHELLRTESESSEIDEFSIAAQKTLFRNRGRSTCCSSCRTVIVFLMLGICLVISAGLIWLHFDMKNSIEHLQDQMNSVEMKNKDSTADIGIYQQQINDLKKSLEISKSEELKKFIQLNSTIDDLKKSSENLKSLMDADSLKELKKQSSQLSQLPVLSQTIAKIGADVKDLQTKVEDLKTFKETAVKQISDLTQKSLQSDDRETKPFVGDDDFPQKLATLQQTVGDLNITMSRRMDMMDSVLNNHRMRFEILDNKTAQIQYQLTQNPASESTGSEVHPPEPGTSLVIPDSVQNQIENKIKDYVKQMLSNRTEEPTTDVTLSGILSNMDNITEMVRVLKDQFVQLKADHSDILQPNQPSTGDNSELMDFKNNALDRLENLNRTVDHLSKDVSTLMHKFILNQNSLTNLTRIVEGIRQYISLLETKFGNQTLKSDDPELANLPPAENINVNVDENQNKTGPTSQPTTTTFRPIIHMKLIKSEDDVDLNLHRWDHNGNGVLDADEIEDLGDYMPDPPTPEQVKMFDFDHNGSLDADELKIALGYKPYPSEDERQQLADLG